MYGSESFTFGNINKTFVSCNNENSNKLYYEAKIRLRFFINVFRVYAMWYLQTGRIFRGVQVKFFVIKI